MLTTANQAARLSDMAIAQQYSLEPADDESLLGAAAIATRTGKPIKLRVQPQLYTQTPGTHRAGMYLGWKGVYWNLTCPTAADVEDVRDAMASFFRVLEYLPGRVLQAELDIRLRGLVDAPALTLPTVIRTSDLAR